MPWRDHEEIRRETRVVVLSPTVIPPYALRGRLRHVAARNGDTAVPDYGLLRDQDGSSMTFGGDLEPGGHCHYIANVLDTTMVLSTFCNTSCSQRPG